MKIQINKKIIRGIAISVLVLFPVFAFAASTGGGDADTGKEAIEKITSLLTGEFGLLMVISSFFLGAVRAAMTHTIMPLVIGVGIALGIHYGPAVMTSIFGAVV